MNKFPMHQQNTLGSISLKKTGHTNNVHDKSMTETRQVIQDGNNFELCIFTVEEDGNYMITNQTSFVNLNNTNFMCEYYQICLCEKENPDLQNMKSIINASDGFKKRLSHYRWFYFN